MTVLKLLGKKRISRSLFKVCRLNNFETLAQIEEYFSLHGSFDSLEWCGPEEKLELESLIKADLLRLASRWQIPRGTLDTHCIAHIAQFLLGRELVSKKQLDVFKSTLMIYQDTAPVTPFEMALGMGTSEASLRALRTRAIGGISKQLRSLQIIEEDLQLNYGLDLTAKLIFLDERNARQINARSGTSFTPQFLSLLYGLCLEEEFSLIGKPEEVLAGNFLGNRHYWSRLYLLKKDLAAAIDLEALVEETARLSNSGTKGNRSLDLKTFVSHFTRNPDQAVFEALLTVTEEILFWELDLQVGKNGRLKFPPKKKSRLLSLTTEALEALGTPATMEMIRRKIEELHPGLFVDPQSFPSILLHKWGFTSYRKVYGLKKWFRKGGGKLASQDPEYLKELTEKFPVKFGTYWKFYWEQRLTDLIAFTETHNRLPVKKAPPEERKLAEWLRRQRDKMSLGRLDPWQQKLYEEFRERFPEKSSKFWMGHWVKRFRELAEFAEANSRFPRKRGPGEEQRLYRWWVTQRSFLKKGNLSLRKKTMLKDLEDRYTVNSESWEDKFRKLKKFAEIHGRLPAQDSIEDEEKALNYFWLRQLEKMKKGELEFRKQELLKDLKQRFPYNSRHKKEAWEKRFEELKGFVEAQGKLPERNSSGREKTLRGWLIAQRVRMKKGELDLRQQRLLTEFDNRYYVDMDMVWKSQWDQKFQELESFAEAHSRLPKGGIEEEKVFYSWLMVQRWQLKKGKLEPGQQKKISEIAERYPIKTSAYFKACWYEKMEELENFAEKNSRLPENTRKEEQPLNNWFTNQNVYYRWRKLDKEQRTRLQKIENKFPVKSHLEKQWELRFRELKRFTEAHSRLPKKKAPSEERSLYYWMKSQLKRMDQGRLGPAQEEVLKDLHEQLCPADTRLAWEDRYEQIKTFIRANSRLPKRTGTSSEEKVLNRWFMGQKHRIRKGTLDPEKQSLIKALIAHYGTGPGNRKPPERGWGNIQWIVGRP